jgi:hypothetical protein
VAITQRSGEHYVLADLLREWQVLCLHVSPCFPSLQLYGALCMGLCRLLRVACWRMRCLWLSCASTARTSCVRAKPVCSLMNMYMHSPMHRSPPSSMRGSPRDGVVKSCQRRPARRRSGSTCLMARPSWCHPSSADVRVSRLATMRWIISQVLALSLCPESRRFSKTVSFVLSTSHICLWRRI